MQETVYRVIEVLCMVVAGTPILRQAQDDESGAGASAVDAGERAIAGDAGGGDPRAFVSAPETCQRLPELALLAGSILTYLAATQPAVPTGSWDRRP